MSSGFIIYVDFPDVLILICLLSRCPNVLVTGILQLPVQTERPQCSTSNEDSSLVRTSSFIHSLARAQVGVVLVGSHWELGSGWGGRRQQNTTSLCSSAWKISLHMIIAQRHKVTVWNLKSVDFFLYISGLKKQPNRHHSSFVALYTAEGNQKCRSNAAPEACSTSRNL